MNMKEFIPTESKKYETKNKENETMENETRELVRDYLNGMYTKEELMNKFDLKECARESCNNVELEEDLIDTEEMINGGIGYVCEGCVDL